MIDLFLRLRVYWGYPASCMSADKKRREREKFTRAVVSPKLFSFLFRSDDDIFSSHTLGKEFRFEEKNQCASLAAIFMEV